MMIKKTKIKFKKGLACLLAALQIGAVTSCTTKDSVSEEEYNTALKTIEELEKEKAALQEELIKKENESIEESKPEENIDEDIDKNVDNQANLKFNQELASSLGITFDMLKDSILQGNINILNKYLGTYENVSYQIQKSESSNEIVFKAGNEDIASVTLMPALISSTSIIFALKYSDHSPNYYINLDENNRATYYNYDLNWNFDNSYYNVGESYNFGEMDSYTYTSYINYTNSNASSETPEGLYIRLHKDEENKYTLNFDNELVIEIGVEDFNELDNLINIYKAIGEYENILSYCGSTIIEIIKKYGQEELCQKYIGIINENLNKDVKEKTR